MMPIVSEVHTLAVRVPRAPYTLPSSAGREDKCIQCHRRCVRRKNANIVTSRVNDHWTKRRDGPKYKVSMPTGARQPSQADLSGRRPWSTQGRLARSPSGARYQLRWRSSRPWQRSDVRAGRARRAAARERAGSGSCESSGTSTAKCHQSSARVPKPLGQCRLTAFTNPIMTSKAGASARESKPSGEADANHLALARQEGDEYLAALEYRTREVADTGAKVQAGGDNAQRPSS